MSRNARTQSSLVLGLVVFFTAALWFAGRQLALAGETPTKGGEKLGDAVVAASAAKGDAAKTSVFPVPADFKVKLLRAGLDARSLCAAGVSSNTILATLQAAADYMNGAPTSLASADTTYASARNVADALLRTIESGKATQEELANYASTQSALQAAEAARASVLDGYFSAASANLPNAQRVVLGNIRANASRGLPAEYLVVSRSEADWVALRDALSNERIALELPDTLSQSAQTLLTTVRADQAVAAARTRVESNLTSITSAWNTAAGD